MSSGNQFVDLIYIMFFGFTLKQVVDIVKSRKKLKTPIATFSQRPRVIAVIMAFLLLFLGISFMLTNPGLIAVICIFIGLAYSYMSVEKIMVSEEGIYFNGRFDRWDEIKQWTFDEGDKNLILKTTKPKNKETRVIPVKPEYKDILNNIIRQRKGKKKNKVIK